MFTNNSQLRWSAFMIPIYLGQKNEAVSAWSTAQSDPTGIVIGS